MFTTQWFNLFIDYILYKVIVKYWLHSLCHTLYTSDLFYNWQFVPFNPLHLSCPSHNVFSIWKNLPAKAGEPTCQSRRLGKHEFNPWVGNILWSRKWQPTLAFLPGKFHGQTSLVDYSPWGHKESNTTLWLSMHNHLFVLCICKTACLLSYFLFYFVF